jgi:hypothetical protein
VNKGKLVSFVKRAEERPATRQRSRVLVAQLGALARHRRCSSFWVKGHQDALLSLLGRNAPPVAPGSRPKRWPTSGQICNSAIKTAARIGPRKMPMMPTLSMPPKTATRLTSGCILLRPCKDHGAHDIVDEPSQEATDHHDDGFQQGILGIQISTKPKVF